jgi:hypothetical protein
LTMFAADTSAGVATEISTESIDLMSAMNSQKNARATRARQLHTKHPRLPTTHSPTWFVLVSENKGMEGH